MMSKTCLLTILLTLATGVFCPIVAEPFAVQATQRVIACNDSDKGPSSSYTSTQLHIRNTTDPRRRVSFVKYDISAIKAANPGKLFSNCYLTLNCAARTSGRNIYVYGVKEELDDVSLSGMNWNTAPGLQNSPVPALNSEITIDTLDAVDLSSLLVTIPAPASTGAWFNSPVNSSLDTFLNADTDGAIILMMITYERESVSFLVYDQTDSRSEPVTTLKGVILRGDIDVASHAYNPVPANGANANPSLLTQLSWIKPDPNQAGGVVTCDVYFHEVSSTPGIGDDPNYSIPGYGYTPLVTGTTNNFVALAPGTLNREKTYRWIVDIHDTTRTPSKTQGFLWSFDTNNLPPVVDAGSAQYLWLNPTSVTAGLNGTVTDDNYPGPYTVLWTQDSGPAVIISPDNVEDTSVALTQVGTYVFRLTANDGAMQRSSAVQIIVSATPCDAAKTKPGYAAPTGDFNNDCSVNLGDFVMIAQNWLKCNSLAACN